MSLFDDSEYTIHRLHQTSLLFYHLKKKSLKLFYCDILPLKTGEQPIFKFLHALRAQKYSHWCTWIVSMGWNIIATSDFILNLSQ